MATTTPPSTGTSVRELFDAMTYGPAPEGDAPVRQWIAAHGGTFGHYINGAWVAGADTFEVLEPATGKPLARVAQGTAGDVAAAVAAARAALPAWQALDDHARARWLYAIARGVQASQHGLLIWVANCESVARPKRGCGAELSGRGGAPSAAVPDRLVRIARDVHFTPDDEHQHAAHVPT